MKEYLRKNDLLIARQFLWQLTSKCVSCQNDVHFCDNTPQSIRFKLSQTLVLANFDTEICFASQRHSLFRHLPFQKSFEVFWFLHLFFVTFQLHLIVWEWHDLIFFPKVSERGLFPYKRICLFYTFTSWIHSCISQLHILNVLIFPPFIFTILILNLVILSLLLRLLISDLANLYLGFSHLMSFHLTTSHLSSTHSISQNLESSHPMFSHIKSSHLEHFHRKSWHHRFLICNALMLHFHILWLHLPSSDLQSSHPTSRGLESFPLTSSDFTFLIFR